MRLLTDPRVATAQPLTGCQNESGQTGLGGHGGGSKHGACSDEETQDADEMHVEKKGLACGSEFGVVGTGMFGYCGNECG